MGNHRQRRYEESTNKHCQYANQINKLILRRLKMKLLKSVNRSALLTLAVVLISGQAEAKNGPRTLSIVGPFGRRVSTSIDSKPRPFLIDNKSRSTRNAFSSCTTSAIGGWTFDDSAICNRIDNLADILNSTNAKLDAFRD